MSEKFSIEQFSTGNNFTHIELKGGDVLYIQLPDPGPDKTEEERRSIKSKASNFFQNYLFEEYDVKIEVEFMPLNITILTKKEEFVARLGDKIVEL